jgi:hypothetical protein
MASVPLSVGFACYPAMAIDIFDNIFWAIEFVEFDAAVAETVLWQVDLV